MVLSLQELNRILHQMQTRVADLIDRCADEIILGRPTSQLVFVITVFPLKLKAKRGKG